MIKLYRVITGLFSSERRNIPLKRWAYLFFCLLSGIYIIFNVFWGINYNRLGIRRQLGLTDSAYTKDELIALNRDLLAKVNEDKASIIVHHRSFISGRKLYEAAEDAYKSAEIKFPFLHYSHRSVKSSMWGWLGNYTGFQGYYNPFTGEAQVNSTIPSFLQPYTTCHEMAHQLGYAKEDEANFAGFLAAKSSRDTIFHYSVYLDMFLYANRNLYMLDTTAAKEVRRLLSPAVKADLKEMRDFNLKHKSFIGPVISWIYGKYLENNQQPAGIMTYDEVTGFLIAFRKKYGGV